jgi:hypothetical protein
MGFRSDSCILHFVRNQDNEWNNSGSTEFNNIYNVKIQQTDNARFFNYSFR